MRFLLFILAALFFSCTKNATDEGTNARLRYLKTAGKITQSFEYNPDGLLVKENWFGSCEKTPADEFTYSYSGVRLDTITSVIRRLYSSTSFICDPAKGLRSKDVVEHDSQGRIHRIVRENGTTNTFHYNAQGLVEKITATSNGGDYVTTFRRDVAGNIIEQTDGQGNTTQYGYDTKTNPYYGIKMQTGTINAFTDSPNNVVNITSAAGGGSTIRYEYNRHGLPVKMLYSGGVYEFIYQ